MPWSFIIPAAASLIGGMMSSDAASDASDSANAQSQKGLDLQKQMFDESVKRQEPFLQKGTEFFNRLAALHSHPETGNEMMKMDPGYGFRLSEGLKSLDRQAAARGGLISGAALKAAQRYGQDYASNEFGNAYNRLAALANTGPRAAGVLTDLGTNYANNAQGVYNNMGMNSGNARLASGSAYGNALGGIGNQLGRWYQTQQGQGIDQSTNLPSYALDPYGPGGG